VPDGHKIASTGQVHAARRSTQRRLHGGNGVRQYHRPYGPDRHHLHDQQPDQRPVPVLITVGGVAVANSESNIAKTFSIVLMGLGIASVAVPIMRDHFGMAVAC